MILDVIDCRQWDRGACRLGLVGGRPSPRRCERCQMREPIDGGAARTGRTLTLADVAHGAAGIAKALIRADKASDETIAARRETCRTCEHNTGGTVTRCRLCGCLLAAKLRLAGEKCPAGKW